MRFLPISTQRARSTTCRCGHACQHGVGFRERVRCYGRRLTSLEAAPYLLGNAIVVLVSWREEGDETVRIRHEAGYPVSHCIRVRTR
jgi:hypothetical protein